MKTANKKIPKQNDPEFTFYPEEATEEDIYAFDSAENWARCMNELQYKLKDEIARKKRAEKRKERKERLLVSI